MEENDLQMIKETYLTVQNLLDAVANGEFNIEDAVVPTSFKRLSFTKGDYKVGDSDFYGNVVVYCDKPKTISVISLMTIHTLMDIGYDRYSTIMTIKKYCEESESTDELIEKIASIIPAIDAQNLTREE